MREVLGTVMVQLKQRDISTLLNNLNNARLMVRILYMYHELSARIL